MEIVVVCHPTDAELATQVADRIRATGHIVRTIHETSSEPPESDYGSDPVRWLVLLSVALESTIVIGDWTVDRSDQHLGQPGMLTVAQFTGTSAPELLPDDHLSVLSASADEALDEILAAADAAAPSTIDDSPEPSWANFLRPVRSWLMTPFTRSWRWLRDQGTPIQALSGVIGVVLGAIAIVLVFRPPHTSGMDPTPPTPPPVTRAPITLDKFSALLVSSGVGGQPGNYSSGRPSLSQDGRYVAFTSAASNLSGGAPGSNIYRKDLETGALYLVSRTPGGHPGNGESQFPSICDNGRFVAFASQADDLRTDGPSVHGKRWRVYLHDTIDGQTYLASVTNDDQDPDADSVSPVLSGDCRTVAYESAANDLSPQDHNDLEDVYVWSFDRRRSQLISVTSSGKTGGGNSLYAGIDPTGRFVSFTSEVKELGGRQAGLYGVYIRDRTMNRTYSVSDAFLTTAARDGKVKGFGWASFSPDGKYLIFRTLSSADPNSRGRFVFVWDVLHAKSAILSPTGQPAGWSDACVSGINNGTRFSPFMTTLARGREVAIFTIQAGTACTVVLRDLDGNEIAVRPGLHQGEIIEPAINAGGSVVTWATGRSVLQVYACYLVATDSSNPSAHQCPRADSP